MSDICEFRGDMIELCYPKRLCQGRVELCKGWF